MSLSESQLHKPALRPLSRLLRKEIERTHHRLDSGRRKGHAKDLLHDSRVSLRRLHTWVQAVSPTVDPDRGKKLNKRVRRLLKKTTGARDLEVEIELLRKWEQDGTKRLASSARLARERLESEDAPADKEIADSLASLKEKVKKLPRRLDKFLEHSPKEIEQTPLVHLMNEWIQNEFTQFKTRWNEAKESGEAKDLHRLRVSGKRVRYLLEPLRENYPAAEATVEQFKKIQRDLGDWHDLEVLAERLETLALESKAQGRALKPVLDHCHRLRTQSVARIHENWLKRAPLESISLS